MSRIYIEKEIKKFYPCDKYCREVCRPLIDNIIALCEKVRAKERKNAFEEAALLADWRLLGECQDKGHDERYCFRCEAMKDAADIIEQKIKSVYTEKRHE